MPYFTKLSEAIKYFAAEIINDKPMQYPEGNPLSSGNSFLALSQDRSRESDAFVWGFDTWGDGHISKFLNPEDDNAK